MSTSRVWLITGSSTGFGRIMAETLLERGDRVVATARKLEQLDELVKNYPETAKAVRLDVTKPDEVREAVETAIATFDRIDVLVNNAGYGALGAIEEVSDENIRRQYETNVFGALSVTRAVLPHLRRQRSGYILNLSSVGGMVSFAGTGIYCSTKFALEGISEALAKEVAPLGIKVMIIEPGSFRTDFNGRSLVVPEQRIDDYAATSGQLLDWAVDVDGKQPGDPAKAIKVILQALDSDNPPLRLVLGADAIQAIDNKLDSVKSNLDDWREAGMNTAYEGAVAGAIGE